MALKSGYFRSRLHVDLSTGRAESIPLADGFLERFIGGRGFGAKIVWDALAAHGFAIDPLGPENTLAIAGGPLTGMYLPSSGQVLVRDHLARHRCLRRLLHGGKLRHRAAGRRASTSWTSRGGLR